MRKFGICVVLLCVTLPALAAVIFPRPAAAEISIRIGPYHFVLGGHGHRHATHHAHPRPHAYGGSPPSRAAQPETRPPASPQAPLYPPLAWPAVLAFVFSSGDPSSWPFDYRSIFLSAFDKAQAQPNTKLCRTEANPGADLDRRIHGAVGIEDAQAQALRDLEHAVDTASASLANACPVEIPVAPLARLTLMESQIEKLTAALDTIRQPLRNFQDSLNDEQRARLAVMISAGSDNQTNTACNGTPLPDWPIAQIDRAIEPTDAQRDALNDLKLAFAAAAKDIAAHCVSALPPTAPSRLAEIQTILRGFQQNVSSIRTALAAFEAKLSDEQKAALNAVDLSGH